MPTAPSASCSSEGDDDVNFAYIAEVIDIGKAANVDHIGLMTPKIMAGQ